ncbi:putative interleukin-17 receptor E-like isoform X1 [Carcharodon carcharias]|uniref:putative interleukin-17 receptor E-like isoform X1 n=2 Tax=Carcharodon carcharias TaxID=13397 RepID=UPI001B7E386D|nr:putative interleukin-17 receptor E-like isoform X1 [Carcharodon carcharias]
MSCCSRLSFLLIILGLSISCCGAVEEITKCGLRCSQGLQCKSKNMTFSDPDRPCRKRLSSLPSEIVEDLKIFTVLKCIKERQCSTHLKVKGTLIINEHIRGVEMCSISMNTLQYQCVVVKFNKQAYKKFTARSVEIEYDCFRAAVAEYTYVTLTTIPYYCDVFIKQVHQVGDCTNKEVGRNIPTCIAGKLDYVIHKTQKILSVQVSDFVEDYAYNVRLCHKWFICEDLGINALIKVQDSKEVTLPYSQLLPCLCIEGWSVLPDARRVQLCPFKNYTAELWNGITYDHVTQELAWELACPVEVGVNLCWMTGSNDHCIDLQDSFYKVQQKVRYSRVDPHPRLCVKFTTDEGFWVRCPFASGYIPVWNMSTDGQLEKLQLTFMTQDKAEFKMALCNRTAPHKCEPLKELYVTANTIGAHSRVFNLSYEECGSNFCVQGWRTDIEYSARIQFCNIMCKLNSTGASSQYIWPIAITVILLILVTVTLFIGYMFCRVLHQPYRKVFLHSTQSSKRTSVDIQGTSPF